MRERMRERMKDSAIVKEKWCMFRETLTNKRQEARGKKKNMHDYENREVIARLETHSMIQRLRMC